MCLLLISTTKFLLFSFALLCIYELVVFLYFRFSKEGIPQLSKNESRKRREVKPIPVQEGTPLRKAEVVTSAASSSSEEADWQSLIGYQRTDANGLREGFRSDLVKSDLQSRIKKETDACLTDLLSSATTEDTSSVVSEERVDAIVEASQETISPKEFQEEVSSMPKKEKTDIKKAFSDFDFSNMVE